MDKISVLHLVDSLSAGGAERMAVSLVNSLPVEQFRSFLCASRCSGPLQEYIKPHVTFYELHRKGRFDILAFFRLVNFVRDENIQIIHAHTTSLFLAAVVCLLLPKLKLIWHDHYGPQDVRLRPTLLYRPFIRRAHIVLTVTRRLAEWSIGVIGVAHRRVQYLPNFAEEQNDKLKKIDLPGKKGMRIVCVANIRAQKDHLTLVRAMEQVVKLVPESHLLLVGAETDSNLSEQVRKNVHISGLDEHITFLGVRKDINQILANVDVGVLSSVSEGFPVTLLEYGYASLAVLATEVGECAEILDNGKAGILVSPGDVDALAKALLHLLEQLQLRQTLGENLRQRVKNNYSQEIIMTQLTDIYTQLISESETA